MVGATGLEPVDPCDVNPHIHSPYPCDTTVFFLTKLAGKGASLSTHLVGVFVKGHRKVLMEKALTRSPGQ